MDDTFSGLTLILMMLCIIYIGLCKVINVSLNVWYFKLRLYCFMDRRKVHLMYIHVHTDPHCTNPLHHPSPHRYNTTTYITRTNTPPHTTTLNRCYHFPPLNHVYFLWVWLLAPALRVVWLGQTYQQPVESLLWVYSSSGKFTTKRLLLLYLA